MHMLLVLERILWITGNGIGLGTVASSSWSEGVKSYHRVVELEVLTRSGDEPVGNVLVDRKRLKAPRDARSLEVERTVPIG